MDVAYSPTGREFVAGSYDRTIRIFNVRATKSREVYHTQRMQRYVCKQAAFLTGSESLRARVSTHVKTGIACGRFAAVNITWTLASMGRRGNASSNRFEKTGLPVHDDALCCAIHALLIELLVCF